MKKPTQIALLILAGVGILLATYLLYSYVYQPTFRPCTINASVNCDAIINGSVSTTLGIPTALYGFIGYIVIFIAALKRNLKVVLGMAIFGTLFCLRVFLIEIFQLKVLCPVCVMCQIVMLSIVSLAITESLRHKS